MEFKMIQTIVDVTDNKLVSERTFVIVLDNEIEADKFIDRMNAQEHMKLWENAERVTTFWFRQPMPM